MNLKQALGLVTRVIIGGVLIYSGVSKALAPSAEFAAALAAYKILPTEIIPVLARVWPWLELLVGTYIFFGYFTQIFTRVACGMFGIFLIVLGSALLRGIDPGSCGCFGIGVTLSIHKTMTLDTFFFMLAILSAAVSERYPPFSVDSWTNN